jgi:hypothetical protein
VAVYNRRDMGMTAAALARADPENKEARTKLDLVRELEDEFRERNDIIKAIDTVVYMQHQVQIPARWQAFALEVKSPLALKAVNTITAALSINAPSTHFEPVRMGTSGDENATLREHFFDASWLRQEDEADRELFRIWMHHLVTHGSAVFKTVECSKTAWARYYTESRKLAQALDDGGYSERERRTKYDSATEEEKRRAAYPILTTIVAPQDFYYVQSERGFSVAVEQTDVPYYEALTLFGAGLDRGKHIVPEAAGLPVDEWSHAMEKSHTLRKIEVWDWEYVWYFLCDPGGSGPGQARLVKKVKHQYGNPLTHTLRGPFFHTNGVSTSSTDHRFAGLSVIFGFLYLYPLFDALLTGLGQGGFQWAYPFLGSDQPPTFPAQGQIGVSPLVGPGGQPIRSTLNIQPGDVLPAGLHFVDPPRLGMDMRSFMEQVRQLLELALPSVVQGVISGDESGYALNQAASLARIEWTPIVAAAERTLSRRTGFESWLIENRIHERVWAWGDLPAAGPFSRDRSGYLSIAPEDLSGAHRYTERLEPEMPSNRVIDLRTHSELVAQRFETWEQAVEAMGNSPSETELGWLLWDLKHDPRSQGKILDRAFALINIREQQERGAAEADILAALGGPPEAMPGMAPGMAPGAGLGAAGQVFQPGQTMPMTPTPQGSVTGVGPGGVPGMPVVPNPPAAHNPLPGQA